ncbi:BglG family transcription antiterminator LicT [Thorsellia anophelis]|uniref:Transcriptional antiterminator, BglG family n=1 Tax=Thorsellia anophelis DSM 18579 TaxID=1123402 RepID=A0A1I0AD74_9GAMM|nr:PRD domain-containing protein [Thorsellia anophelis]SES91648.1 transcriptional antiterminator, BglG family [Thorsellia anophelis DSM 18579]
MRITKILNNNVVLIKNERNIEQVVMGRGIAFKKQVGDEIEECKIEKIFSNSNHQLIAHLSELLSQIPLEIMTTVAQIIQLAESRLGKLHEMIYIGLTDHCHFAIERLKEGIVVENIMFWELKRLYPREIQLGIEALDLIEKRLQVKLPFDEAGFIAIHFVNAQQSNPNLNSSITHLTKLMQDILQIVKYQLHIEFDEGSLSYQRFVTHLRFFAQRMIGHQPVDSEDSTLHEEVKLLYPQAYQCVESIEAYIIKHYKQALTKDERMFLSIHIERIRKDHQEKKS